MDHIFRFDFGYGWPWTYGHLVACGIFVALAVVTWRRGWPRSLLALAVALATWAMAGFAVTHLVIRMNLPVEMLTTAFLRDAAGPVAPSGRSSRTTSGIFEERRRSVSGSSRRPPFCA